MNKYDLIVIGMGPAGMAAVGMGTKMGLKVLGIEKKAIGGECLNVGCIPSKAILKAARIKHDLGKVEDFGMNLECEAKIKNPLEIVRRQVDAQTGEVLEEKFSNADLLLKKGSASFVDNQTVEVDGEQYKGDLIFIATGTEPMVPPIDGLSEVPYLTNENIFDLEEIPKRLTIIGGGAIGVEIAQAFSRLGSSITIVHMDDQLAPSEDSEASALLEKTFEKEGIVYYNGKKIESVKNKSDGIYTETTAGTFVSDQILVATGRKPAFDFLNLEAAGIDYDKKHIKVDAFNRTNIKNIYALGDINGKWLFTHAAMHQAMLSLMQALGNNETKHLEQDNYVVPRAIFTDPEIAQVGLTENEVKKNELNYFLIKEYYKNYARAVTDGSPEGFVKIITDDSGKIYGATIVGERASELITEWTLAMQHNLKMMDILMTQHTFPTFSVLNKNAAEKWMMKLASEGKLGEIF